MNNNASLAHKSIKNSIFNAIGWIWPIGLNLACMPYIVHRLGNDAYGILAIVMMVTGYFAFLNLGLGSAGLKYISEYYVKRDYDTVSSIINTLTLVYGILGIVGMIFIIALTNIFVQKLFKISLDMINITKFSFYLSAVGFLVTFVRSVYVSVPKALNRFDIENTINIVLGSASTLLVVLILHFNYGLREVVIIQFSIGIAMLSIFFITVKKLMPFYRVTIVYNKNLIKKLFNFAIYDFFTQLANISINQLAKLFISVLLGPASLTYFVVSQKLTERVNGFIFKISEILFPIASEMSSTNQIKRLHNIYLKMFRITLAFKFAIYIPIILFSYKILYFWMGKDFAEKGWLALVFLSGGFFLISLGQIPGLINLGVGKPKNNAVYTLSTMIIMLLTMYPLIKLMSISGAALSFFVSGFPVIIFIYFINIKVMIVKNSIFLKKVYIKPLQAGLMQICLIVAIIKLNLVSNMGNLLLFFLLSIISYFIFALMFKVFEKGEKEHILDWIKSTLYSK